jgi:hypothetical protein
MATRKNKKQKREAKKRNRRARARRSMDFPADDIVLVEPPGAVKMSQVMIDFLKPYADQWHTPVEYENLVDLATVAWNAALAPVDQREAMLNKVVESVPGELRQDMRTVLEAMIRRKEIEFAWINRGIVNTQVTRTPTGLHVSVVSTLEIG